MAVRTISTKLAVEGEAEYMADSSHTVKSAYNFCSLLKQMRHGA